MVALRANDTDGEALTPCLLAGSVGLVTTNGETTSFSVPLELLGVTTGELTRLSVQDQSGDPNRLLLADLSISPTQAETADLACG